MIYWKNFDFNSLEFVSSFDGFTEKKEYENKKQIKIRYSNTRFNLDTETTSYFIKEDGSLMMFDDCLDSDFYETTKKQGLVWIWMFSINGQVLYGRRIEEVAELLKKVQEHYAGMKLIIYVHNLSFDFEFLLNAFEKEEIQIFARKSRKMIYARVGKNVEFRCSYFLTNMSLDNFAKSYKLPVQKLVGCLDYNKMRTPLTNDLTEEELAYCEHDCLVLDEIIKFHKARYHSIVDIPLTQTGKIRSQINHMFYKDLEHHNFIKKISPDNFEDYELLTKIFQGGFTHANPLHSGHIVENVLSYDITSSYPFEMTTNKFSCSQYCVTTKKLDEIDRETEKFIVDFTVNGCRAKTSNHIMSISKASKIITGDLTVDNGRLVSVEDKEYEDEEGNKQIEVGSISYILLDDDWDMFNLFYEFDKIQIHHIYTAEKDYLPLKLIKYILELYKEKTKLKDVEGQEVVYTEKKIFVNGIFGMTCTKSICDDIVFDRNSKRLWRTEELTPEKANEKIKEQSKRKGQNLAFAWGPEIAAAGRRHLLEIVWELGEAEAYCDTDSHKIVLSKTTKERVAEIFCQDNAKVLERIWKVIEHFGEENLSFEDFAPCDIHGEMHVLGLYSKEKDIKRFATLGAKKYACEYYSKEEYEKKMNDLKEKHPDWTEKKLKEELPFVKITVAGINKKTGSASLQRLEQFKVNRFFDYNDAGKSEAYYNDDQEEVTFPDGFVSKYKFGICLKPATYFLNVTDDYSDLLENCLDELLEGGSILFK